MFKKLDVRKRLIGGFVLVASISLVVGVFAMDRMNALGMDGERMYTHGAVPMASLVSIAENFQLARVQSRQILLASTPEAKAAAAEATERSCDTILSLLDEQEALVLTDSGKKVIGNAKSALERYRQAFESSKSALMAPGATEATLTTALLGPVKDAQKALAKFTSMKIAAINELAQQQQRKRNDADRVVLALIVAGVFLSVALGVWIAKLIIRPIEHVSIRLDGIAKGQIPDPMTEEYWGEFETLRLDVNRCIEGLQGVLEADKVLQHMAVNDYTVEMKGRYEGLYGELATALSAAQSRVVNSIRIMEDLARGEIEENLAALKRIGKRSENDTLIPAYIQTMENIQKMLAGFARVTRSVEAGDFTDRGRAELFTGDWNRLVLNINQMIESLVKPLELTSSTLDTIARGQIPEAISGSFKGEHERIRQSINNCVEGLQGLVESNQVLQRMAVNDQTLRVEGRYPGIFGEVAAATNTAQSRVVSATEICKRIAKGDLSDLDTLRRVGKRSVNDEFVPAYILMLESLESLCIADGGRVLKAASEGDLTVRMNGTYSGAYAAMRDSVNGLMDTLARLLAEDAGRVLQSAAGGDLTQMIRREYKGSFEELKNNVNFLISSLADIIRQLQGNSQTLAGSSEELSAISAQMLAGSEQMVSQSIGVAGATEQMSSNIGNMAAAAEQMSANAGEVATSAEQLSHNMNVVAAAVEEMSASINQISRNADEAMSVSNEATASSRGATETMKRLGDAAKEIGKVTDVIKRIADQTNLLALNATIEAASAGEAGKGFAVVANEIKELAAQSARAADDIARRIEGVQENTGAAVDMVDDVSGIIQRIETSVKGISMSVEQQTRASSEISSNVGQASTGSRSIAVAITEVAKGSGEVSRNSSEAAKGSHEVAANIAQVRSAASESNKGAQQVSSSAGELARMAGELQDLVKRFRV